MIHNFDEVTWVNDIQSFDILLVSEGEKENGRVLSNGGLLYQSMSCVKSL